MVLSVALCRYEHTWQMDERTDTVEISMVELQSQKGKQPAEQSSTGDQEHAPVEKGLDMGREREDIIHLKTAPLHVFTCGAATAIACTLSFYPLPYYAVSSALSDLILIHSSSSSSSSSSSLLFFLLLLLPFLLLLVCLLSAVGYSHCL